MKKRILAIALALAVSPFVFAAGKQAPDTTNNAPVKTKHKRAHKAKKHKKAAEQK